MTDLTDLVCGLLLLACMFIAPVSAVIPTAVTSAALMLQGLISYAIMKVFDGKERRFPSLSM